MLNQILPHGSFNPLVLVWFSKTTCGKHSSSEHGLLSLKVFTRLEPRAGAMTCQALRFFSFKIGSNIIYIKYKFKI